MKSLARWSFLPTLLLAFAACDPGAVDMSGLGGDDGTGDGPGGTCEGLLGAPQATGGMTECCTAEGGGSHCVAEAGVPAEFKQYTPACEGGAGLCVPDVFITTGGVHTPPACTSEKFTREGVCLSACIPQVAEVAGLLDRGIGDAECAAYERCVPCVSPLDNMPTGACDIKGECVDGQSDEPGENPPPGSGDDPSTCVREGDPFIDPSTLPPCGEGAHCVQASLVPAEFASQLAPCADASQLCVPDPFLVSGGKFIAPTCRSLNDAEGRCVNQVVPQVAEQADLLPKSTCGAGELCVPCYNPLDGASTGACNLSCDTGPVEPAKALAACCEGRAKCVPNAAVPEAMQSNLGQDDCQDIQEDAYLCVPNDLLAYQLGTGPAPPACAASGFLVGDYTGVCLSDCLEFGLQGIALARGNCQEDYKCAPCVNPLNGQPTGAPGCPGSP